MIDAPTILAIFMGYIVIGALVLWWNDDEMTFIIPLAVLALIMFWPLFVLIEWMRRRKEGQ